MYSFVFSGQISRLFLKSTAGWRWLVGPVWACTRGYVSAVLMFLCGGYIIIKSGTDGKPTALFGSERGEREEPNREAGSMRAGGDLGE